MLQTNPNHQPESADTFCGHPSVVPQKKMDTQHLQRKIKSPPEVKKISQLYSCVRYKATSKVNRPLYGSASFAISLLSTSNQHRTACMQLSAANQRWPINHSIDPVGSLSTDATWCFISRLESNSVNAIMFERNVLHKWIFNFFRHAKPMDFFCCVLDPNFGTHTIGWTAQGLLISIDWIACGEWRQYDQQQYLVDSGTEDGIILSKHGCF